MANAIEIEAKVLLNREDYKKLAKEFIAYPHVTQTNYYIDSDDHILSRNNIALRVREKGGQYELTLKTPLSEGLLEKNCVISPTQFEAFRVDKVFPKGDTSRFLTMLDIDTDKLHILASLTTDRIELDYKGGVLCIDRNSYLDIVDYEVEFEYNSLSGAEAVLSALLETHGIPVHFSRLSKTARAMNAMKD